MHRQDEIHKFSELLYAYIYPVKMLQGSSMISEFKTHIVFENFSFLSDFIELFLLIILVKTLVEFH